MEVEKVVICSGAEGGVRGNLYDLWPFHCVRFGARRQIILLRRFGLKSSESIEPTLDYVDHWRRCGVI